MRLRGSLAFLLQCHLTGLADSALTRRNHVSNLDVEDLVRIRADLDETRTTSIQWEGQALIYKPGQTPQVAFDVLGMNVARAKRLADGSYDLLSRELQLYMDPRTSEVLHFWQNPFTNETVNVIHVQNNPVYQTLPGSATYSTRGLPNRYSTFTLNIPLAYPNPLNPTNVPSSLYKPYQGSYQALYSAIESFTYTFSDDELVDKSCTTLSSMQVYWTRTSPLLPWMNSPDTNATLLFLANGAKVDNGFPDLHPTLHDVIDRILPSYREAPMSRTRPGGGVTSWSFFAQPHVVAAWKNGTAFPISEVDF